ncbi:Tetratricopeptide repeat protein 33 [Morus notabilis]|uniref:Tetratricopeptide repeat protein 33 n=1 Tax=Morus notabilis TaxID=981085 RepID=W9S213_9ROSA|nr:Tetratricopeptide repeat protein 33 [Morus notabilis]
MEEQEERQQETLFGSHICVPRPPFRAPKRQFPTQYDTRDCAVLHEQKAQVLLEIADAWSALKAATHSGCTYHYEFELTGATELEPSWAEAWITLGRAQLNFGEPDSAIQSFDRALAIKPDSEEAQVDRRSALHLVKRRKQLHSSGLSTTTNRYAVGNESESS